MTYIETSRKTQTKLVCPMHPLEYIIQSRLGSLEERINHSVDKLRNQIICLYITTHVMVSQPA